MCRIFLVLLLNLDPKRLNTRSLGDLNSQSGPEFVEPSIKFLRHPPPTDEAPRVSGFFGNEGKSLPLTHPKYWGEISVSSVPWGSVPGV